MVEKNGSCKREIYLKHIEYLEDELERYQHKRDILRKKHKDLSSRYGALEKRHSDISKKLELSWAEGEKTEKELTEQLKCQKQAWEREREALELQHCQRVQKLKEQIDELNSKIVVKSEELKVSTAKNEECEKQVMEQLPRIKSLEMQNKEIEAATVKKREQLQKMKTRISEEKVKVYAEAKASFILQEKRAEARKMSRASEILLKEIARGQKEVDALQIKVNILLDEERKKEEMENEYRKKQDLEDKHVVQKTKELEVELKTLSVTNKQMLATEKNLRRDLDIVSKENRQQSAKAKHLEAEIQKERSRIRQLERTMWEADIIIKDILEDPGDSEEMPTIDWKIERLLDIMECTAPIDTGTDRSSQGQKLQTKTRKPARKL